jgi:vacuolar-type H+-ATPase subunit H
VEREILDAILEAERRITERLGEEERKKRAWLEKVRKEVETKEKAAGEKLRREYEEALEEARKEAERGAGRLVREAEERARALRELDDGVFREVVRRHITRISPAGP